jgi:hypothetical protein
MECESMKKNYIYGVLLLFVVLTLSISVVSADDLTSYKNGTVSGGVIVDGTERTPFPNSTADDRTYAEFTEYIPANATSIQYLGLFVNVYSGSGMDTYGANTTITITLPNRSVLVFGNNILKHPLGLVNLTNDPTVYNFNDYKDTVYSVDEVTLQYSDYQYILI